jgi:hypothetical protein
MKKTTVKFSIQHYNGKFNVSIEGPAYKVNDLEIAEKRSRTGLFILRKYRCAVPIYTFGFLDDSIEFRPTHGGEWSSSAETINEVFGTNLVEVIYNGCIAAFELKWLKNAICNHALFNGNKIAAVIKDEFETDVDVDESEAFEPTVENKTVSIPEDLYDRVVDYFDGKRPKGIMLTDEEIKLLTDLENCK